MPSTLYVGLQQRIGDYERYFLSDKDDLDCETEDFIKAVAFRVLCSALLEEYVEQRCKEIAATGIDRLSKGQSTSTGRSLVVWWVSRNIPDHIPIHVEDVDGYFANYQEVLKAYMQSVDDNHGLNAKDFRRLVNPVGLRATQLPPGLGDKLQALADRRDPTVHGAATKTVGRVGPNVLRAEIRSVCQLLAQLDAALDEVATTYPLPPT